ncbi:MAG: hypothetical protein WDZ76_10245 [Pseudohongiellaceae bacterium]
MVTNTGKTRKANSESREEFNEARESAMEAYANLLDARDKFYSAAKHAGIDVKEGAVGQFGEVMDTANEKTSEFIDRSEAYIRDRPITCAGIAFATGFVLSKLMKK